MNNSIKAILEKTAEEIAIEVFKDGEESSKAVVLGVLRRAFQPLAEEISCMEDERARMSESLIRIDEKIDLIKKESLSVCGELDVERQLRQKADIENKSLSSSLTASQRTIERQAQDVAAMKHDVIRTRNKYSDVEVKLTHFENCKRLTDKLVKERGELNQKLAEAQEYLLHVKKEFKDLHCIHVTVKEECRLLEKRTEDAAVVIRGWKIKGIGHASSAMRK